MITYSCSIRKHYAVRGEFRYYNLLQGPIIIKLHQGMQQLYATYNIQPSDFISISTTGQTYLKEPVDPKFYKPALLADTTVIQFNDTLCYIEYNNSGSIVENINSYTYERRSDRDYYFTLIWTVQFLTWPQNFWNNIKATIVGRFYMPYYCFLQQLSHLAYASGLPF